MMGDPVLILGQSERAALTIVRSLGAHGLDVHVGTWEPDGPVAQSRYVARCHPLPDPREDARAYARAVAALLASLPVSLAIPVEDLCIVPLMAYRGECVLSKVSLPTAPQFDLAFNKAKTIALAAELGVPVPRTRVVGTLEELDLAGRTFDPPIVIKPAQSCIVWNGKARPFSVGFARAHDELLDKGDAVLPYQPLLLQEFWPGEGIGQEFLCRRGRIIAAFEHVRIHEPQGGGSLYRRSAALSPDLLDFSRRLAERLEWDGFIMFEYRVGPRGPALLEINGRPWGSLPLAVFAGVDFPTIFWRAFVDGDPPPLWPVYRVGVRSRLLHADLKLLALRTVRAIKSPSAVLPWMRHLCSFLNILTGRETCDVEKPHDPRPAFALWRQKLRGLWSEIGQRTDLLTRKVWRRIRRHSPRRRRGVEELLKRARKVLFVCQGNICRSPYAEGCLRSMAHGLLEVQSRGLSCESGRKSPPTARAVARERGVDLERHRSQAVDEPVLQWADLVIAMDVKMLQDLRRRFPQAVHKALLPGEIVTDRPFPLEIPDPWAAGREEYERVFDLIHLLAGQLASRRLSP